MVVAAAAIGYKADEAKKMKQQIIDKITEYESTLKICDRLDKEKPHLPMERRLIVQEARQAFEDRLQDWRNALRVFDRMMHTFERAEKVKGQSNEVLLKAFILKDLDEFKKYTDQSKLEQVARTNIRRVIDYYFSDDETLKDFFRDKK